MRHKGLLCFEVDGRNVRYVIASDDRAAPAVLAIPRNCRRGCFLAFSETMDQGFAAITYNRAAVAR